MSRDYDGRVHALSAKKWNDLIFFTAPHCRSSMITGNTNNKGKSGGSTGGTSEIRQFSFAICANVVLKSLSPSTQLSRHHFCNVVRNHHIANATPQTISPMQLLLCVVKW
jgi:hypothetical protein